MAVPLADFVVAVGDVSRNELERVCPFPALLDLGPGAARSQSALRWGDDASVQAAARLTRLRASVIRAPVLSLLFLAPSARGRRS